MITYASNTGLRIIISGLFAMLAIALLLMPTHGFAQDVPQSQVIKNHEQPTSFFSLEKIAPEKIAPEKNSVRDMAETKAVSKGYLRLLGFEENNTMLSGEYNKKTMPVFLTQEQALAHVRLELAYKSAVSIMPEVSKIIVRVNNRVLFEGQIQPSAEDRLISIAVPENTLLTGFNSVEITTNQHHRVDCSLNATYELWTKINPARTGFYFTDLERHPLQDVFDIPSLAADATGTVTIATVIPRSTDHHSIEQILSLVQAITIRGHFPRVRFKVMQDIDQSGDNGADLTLVLGNPEVLRAKFGTLVEGNEGMVFKSLKNSSKSILIVSSASSLDIDNAISELLNINDQAYFSKPMIEQAFLSQQGLKLKPQSIVKFNDLGVKDLAFTGRLLKLNFAMAMPYDFYPAAYDQLKLILSGFYAPGLSSEAKIIIRVNGHEAAVLPLPKSGGENLNDHTIPISLQSLKPGLNNVDFEVQVPNAADTSCYVQNAVNPKTRFFLSGQSRIEIPMIARIAHMPNLSVTTASGFPYGQSADNKLFFTKLSSNNLDALLTFLAAVAANAQTITKFSITQKSDDLIGANAMIIGPIDDLPSEILESFNFDYPTLKNEWQRNLKSRKPLASSDNASFMIGATQKSRMSLSKFTMPATRPTMGVGIQDDAASNEYDILSRLGKTVAEFSDKNLNLTVRDFTWLYPKSTKNVIDKYALMLVAQEQGKMEIAKPYEFHNAPTWTLITAPNAESLSYGMMKLTEPNLFHKIESGYASVSDTDDGLKNYPAQDDYFIMTSNLSPSNLRLIAAGWLSSNIEIYALICVAVAIGLGFLTHIVVRKYGNIT